MLNNLAESVLSKNEYVAAKMLSRTIAKRGSSLFFLIDNLNLPMTIISDIYSSKSVVEFWLFFGSLDGKQPERLRLKNDNRSLAPCFYRWQL